MSAFDQRVARLRGLIDSAGNVEASLASLVAITGSVQNIHFHFGPSPCGTSGAETADPVDVERSRRLIGIRARLSLVPGGDRKVASYLRREFGKADPEDLFGADLERLYSWVHSLPTTGGSAR